MLVKINDIPQTDIENENEKRWFNIIKQSIKNSKNGYGEIEVLLNLKGGKVTNVKCISKDNFNIGSN